MFSTLNYEVTKVDKADIHDITEIYNSHPEFLRSHVGVEKVDDAWVLKECHEMRRLGFQSCKIIDIKNSSIIGFMDFNVSAKTYLSLMMIDGKFAHNGVGKEVFESFAHFVKSQNSQKIRIDVLMDNNDSVLRFWGNRGFVAEEEIILCWNDNQFPALKMIKALN